MLLHWGWINVIDLVIVVMIWVEHFNNTLSNKEHFLDITLVTKHLLSGNVKSTVHLNDEFVGKTSLTLIKEVIE
jgi:hypothetical protein